MSDTKDVITPESLGFIGGFGFGEPPPDPNPNNNETTEPTEKPVDKVDEKPENKESQKLADLLRADREARAQRTKETDEANSVKKRNDELVAELNAIKKAPSFEDDPVGYCKSKKLSPQTQIALGEALLYDLAPDKAPPDLRFKLFEAKTKREAEQRELQYAEEQSKRDLEFATKQIQNFADTLSDAAKSFSPGSYPESEAWFTNENEEFDHDTYSRSLMATATNLSNSANKQGKKADLSVANIAKTLEAELFRRMNVRDNKRKATTTIKTEVKDTGSKQTVETTSSKGLNPVLPTKPAMTDAERIKRAAAVAFK